MLWVDPLLPSLIFRTPHLTTTASGVCPTVFSSTKMRLPGAVPSVVTLPVVSLVLVLVLGAGTALARAATLAIALGAGTPLATGATLVLVLVLGAGTALARAATLADALALALALALACAFARAAAAAAFPLSLARYPITPAPTAAPPTTSTARITNTGDRLFSGGGMLAG